MRREQSRIVHFTLRPVARDGRVRPLPSRLWLAAALLTLTVSAGVALGHGLGTRRSPNPPGAPNDHFLCYRAKDAKQPKFAPIPGVSLADGFAAGTADIKKPLSLCAPADKMGEGIVDALTHLEGYAIKPVEKLPTPAGVHVVNQFGEVVVNTRKPKRLLVPTAKDLTAIPPVPGPNDVDHYQCYPVVRPKGRPKYQPIPNIAVTDQFGSRIYDLVKPVDLCAPVDKRGEGIKNPSGHLLCYQAKLAKMRPAQAKPSVTAGVGVTNQFGSARLDTLGVYGLCVPSTIFLESSATPTPTSATNIPTPSPTQTSTLPPPFITDFNPKTAHIGETVTISGGNFTMPTGEGPQVSINSQGGGTIFAPVAAFSATSITIVVPAGAASGPLRVTVDLQTASSNDVLTIVPASDFTLAVVPGSTDVIRGHAIGYAVSLASTNGFTQLANLAVSGLPAGLSATFSPPRITAGQTSLLTITAPANQPLGTGTFLVTASATVQGIPESESMGATINVRPASMSFLGRTVVADSLQTPLGGVTVRFLGRDFSGSPTGCSAQTQSDAAGNFMMASLPSACLGTQLVRYDGSTATSPAGTYAGVDLLYTFDPGQVTTPTVLIHLPRIDDAETVWVQQNAPVDQTFTFQTIPGLSVTVYAGTIISLADGSHPDPFPLIAIQVPVDRLPDPMPDDGTVMPFIVAFQPANSTASQPIAVTFPNTLNAAPGATLGLSTLDPTKGAMVLYGTGTVSSDGTQIVPDLDPAYPGRRFGLVHFDWHGQRQNPAGVNPDDRAPGCSLGNCSECAQTDNSVDLSSGLEVRTSIDMAIDGLRAPISIVRTYRTRSTNQGPFGIGSNHNYGYELDISAVQQGQGVINLVMPDGGRFPFNLQADGTFVCQTVPGLQGAVLSRPGAGYRLRWKNGTTMDFETIGAVTVLTAITDANGNRITLVHAAPTFFLTEIIDGVGRSMTLTYDGVGRITSVTDPIGRVVRYAYNGQGTLATFTNAAGGVTQYTYDSQNRLVGVRDPLGVLETQLAYDQNGRVVQETLADGGVTTFDYVLLNPALPALSPIIGTTVTDALGHPTIYRFSPQGFLLDVTDALGQTRVFEREAGTNLLLAVRGVAACSVCGVQAPDESFTYDANGNPMTRTDALGNTTTYTYEPTFHRVASITDALGHVTQFGYDGHGNLLTTTDPSGQTTTFAYDTVGLLTSATDALGNVRTLAYDDLGNLVRVADPLGNVSTRSYDVVGRLKAATDARGRTTRLSYDNLDRRTAVDDPAGGTTQLTYDANSNLLSVVDSLNHSTAYDYDEKGRLALRTDPLGASESFEYDQNDNLIRHTDRKGQLGTFVFDSLNRQVGASYADGAAVNLAYDARGRLVGALDSGDGEIVRTYDLLDRLIQESSGTGTLGYAYDVLGRRISMTVTGQAPVNYGYDGNSRVTEIVQGGQAVSFDYDAIGRRTRLTLPNGVTTEYAYDAASRITQLLYQNGASVLGDLSYEYDAVGNRTRVGGSFARTLLPSPVSATYDAANRQLQSGGKTMLFDANGNLAVSTDASGTANFIWDARGRLVQIRGPDTAADFEYDAFGRRMARRINGHSVRYLYDRFDIVQELVDDGAITLLRSIRIDEPLLRNGTEHYLADALGSILTVIDPSGEPQAVYTYGPFGGTEAAGVSSNAFQFTGRENDGTGLYYYRARFYSPTAGRFISEDPLGFRGGDLNLNSYVGNNPVSATDPLGLYTPTKGQMAAADQAANDISKALRTASMLGATAGPVYLIGEALRLFGFDGEYDFGNGSDFGNWNAGYAAEKALPYIGGSLVQFGGGVLEVIESGHWDSPEASALIREGAEAAWGGSRRPCPRVKSNNGQAIPLFFF